MTDVQDSVDQIMAFLEQWPPGTHLTTRGMQVKAGIRDLALTGQAAEQLCAAGILDVQQIGSTRLWSRPRPQVRRAATPPPPAAAPATLVARP